MSREKALNLLGLAQVAGQLVSGEEGVLKAVRSGRAKLVVLASDLSPRSEKNLENKCLSYEVPVSQTFTKADISRALGRKRAVCAFLETGFSRSYRHQIQNIGEYKMDE